MNIEKHTKEDMQTTVKRCILSAEKLGFDFLPVKDIRRKHLRLILDGCAEFSRQFSANTYNSHRKYLSVLFAELNNAEIVEGNPVKDIPKRKVIVRQREILSDIEFYKVDTFLKEKQYNFWRFFRIFFASGSRISEMMELKKENIFPDKGFFIVKIKKGRAAHECKKPINVTVAELWNDLYLTAKPGEYIFARDLQPGSVYLPANNITRTWKKLVKDNLGINVDFYALKHLYTTKLVNIESEQAAARMNGHTSTAMVVKIYDVGRDGREMEKLRNVNVLL